MVAMTQRDTSAFLTREEERALWVVWFDESASQADRDDARHRIIAGVFPLTVRLARRFCEKSGWNDHQEAESAAAFGVVEAFDRFDPERGKRFSTLAGLCAYHAMSTQYKSYKRHRSGSRVIEDVPRCVQNHSNGDDTQYNLEFSGKVARGRVPEPPDQTASESERHDELKKLSKRLMTRLSPEQQQVVKLTMLGGMSVAAAARELGYDRESVRKLHYTARYHMAFEVMRMGEARIADLLLPDEVA